MHLQPSFRRSLALAFVLSFGAALAAQAPIAPEAGDDAVHQPSGMTSGAPPLEVITPPIAIEGVEATVTIHATDYLPASEVRVEIRNRDGELKAAGSLRGDGGMVFPDGVETNPSGSLSFLVHAGEEPYEIALPGHYSETMSFELGTISGWLTILPPLLAIALALALRQVVPALFAGVWIGATVLAGNNPVTGALRAVDQYVIGSLGDSDRVSIIIFSLLLGGMVGVISRSGGTVGLVEAFAPYATTGRRGQLVAWVMGILIFFDDYANTLIVGNTMRPITDRLKISREKLAYIVDSTAAPVASVALISTWIGYEVSLISDALKQLGSDLDAYSVFIQSLPYRFYPILALFFGLFVATSRLDWGPMLTAERRARKGELLASGATPLADFDSHTMEPLPDRPRRWINAVLPVLSVLLVTFFALWLTGRGSLIGSGAAEGTQSLGQLGLKGIGTVFSEGNSFRSLLYASLTGSVVALVLAVSQRILTVGEGMTSWINGIKSMTMAIVILVLAWSLADVCRDLSTSGFLGAQLSDQIDPRFLPVLVFILAAFISFSTGTSWGTMAILIPLAVPTAYQVAQAAGMDPDAVHRILLGAVSSVLAGAIFGDHCSPISDTTVLSSMASGCDHVDHVRTQLPYALLVAGVGIVVGDVPSAFGVSPYVCIVVAAVVLAVTLRFLGRRAST